MIITLDRKRGWMTGGGVYAPVNPDGDVLRPWCRAAMREGYDLDGMTLHMMDDGAWLGTRRRNAPMPCMTIFNAAALLTPKPIVSNRKRSRARKNTP